jgi:hypothetical protein
MVCVRISARALVAKMAAAQNSVVEMWRRRMITPLVVVE